MALGLVVADSITLVMHDVERMIATFLKASTGDIKDCGISNLVLIPENVKIFPRFLSMNI